MEKLAVQNPITSFWKLLFQPTEVFVKNFFGQSLLKQCLEKNNRPVFVNMDLLFLLTFCANSLANSFPYKYMSGK